MRADDFRAALEAGDVRLVRKLWSATMTHLPRLEDAETAMHMARTQAETVSLKARVYSHRWLCERGLASQLPDKLKPAAERLYPRVVTSVGISCNTNSAWLKPAMIEVRGAMENAVLDCYANGDQAPAIVRPRMNEARESVMRSLFGKRA